MRKTFLPKVSIENPHFSLIHDGVSEHEQTLKASRPFWVLLAGNLGVPTWLMGVLIAGMSLGVANSIIVLIVGALVGSILPALTSTLGPLSRLSQMEAGRFSLGQIGKRVSAFLNWIGAIGWDVINNIFSATAFVILASSFGIPLPFWLALAGLVIVQMMIGIYGHHLVQASSRYTGPLLAITFVLIGCIAMHHVGMPTIAQPPALKDIISGLLLIIIYNAAGWTTYTADYTRYLPRQTPSWLVFLGIFAALFLSTAVLAFFGYMTAVAVTTQTPAGIMQALQQLTGSWSPLVLALIVFSSIPVNAINDNSAAYCLISAGFKLPRPVSATIGAVLGYGVCLAATDNFIEFFENFLLLFGHWIAPWAAILLVHWYCLGKRPLVTPPGITTGCVIFVAVTGLSLALFSANPIYTGLIAAHLGGLDIGPYVGFFTAGLVYYFVLRLQNSKAIQA